MFCTGDGLLDNGSLSIWWSSVLVVRGCGYAELALFSAANTLRLIVLLMPQLVSRVASPLMNNIRANGESRRYKQTFWSFVAGNGAIGLLVAGLCALLGRTVLHLFGKDFVGSRELVFLILASAVLEVVAGNLYQAIFASRSLWWHAAITAVWSAVLVGCSTLLIRQHGASGLALAYLAAWAISTPVYAGVARREVNSRFEASLTT